MKTLQEVQQAMAAEVPQNLIRQLDKGGMQIDYVNLYDLKDLLDQRCDLWHSEVRSTTVMGPFLCLVVRITIETEDGQWHSDGIGQEQIGDISYGETAVNAYAQAFRRAAEGFGLGREMWRKDHKSGSGYSYGQHYQAPPSTSAPGGWQQAPPAQTPPSGQAPGQPQGWGQTAAPPPPPSPQPAYQQQAQRYYPPSEAQMKAVYAISRKLNIDANEISNRVFGVDVDQLGKKQVSELIDEMDKIQTGGRPPAAAQQAQPPQAHPDDDIPF